MKRVADHIIETLANKGVRHIFLVTGGGAMHLNDAIGKEGRIQYVCNHHEQACAMAAEGYARIAGKPGVVCVTSGPGAINALNGVFGAFTDSIPMVVLSGQVKRATLLATHGLKGKLRQLGDQEVDIVEMARSITKYAVMVDDPESIPYHLDKAWHLACSGRPGPVWLDIPIDVQGSMIEPPLASGYDPKVDLTAADQADLSHACEELLDRIARAERPVLLAGTGVRAAGAVGLFRKVVQKLGIPVTTAWTHDLIPSADPLFCGRPGSIGDRAGNFTVQNSDCLLVIGSRLNIRQVSYNWEYFARGAWKAQVDIDPAELEKPLVPIDMRICCDAREFLTEIDKQVPPAGLGGRHAKWVAWCRERRERYPVFEPLRQASRDGAINPYHFATVLFEELSDDDAIVCGDATACIVTFQCADIRGEMRLFSNSGAASMGYDLPAAIGAAVARGGGRVICLAGDGSLQMNIQELQTVAHNVLPIKLFVLNNGGYLSIRQTQANFFGRQVGASPESGVSFPDLAKLSDAYGLKFWRLDKADFRQPLREALAFPGPTLCEVVLDPERGFEPKLTSRRLPDGRLISSPLEDMAPFLDRAELAANMLIPLVEEPG